MGTSNVVDLAFFEYKVTRQVATGNGEKYLAQGRPPRWFFLEELGYGPGHGPSLEENLRRLEKTNAEHRRILAARERAEARRSKQERGRRMRAAVGVKGGPLPARPAA